MQQPQQASNAAPVTMQGQGLVRLMMAFWSLLFSRVQTCLSQILLQSVYSNAFVPAWMLQGPLVPSSCQALREHISHEPALQWLECPRKAC